MTSETTNIENPFSPGKPRHETRIVVAMSGGVDSSVVAALMHEQGYEVVGITLQLYDHGSALAKKGACCAGQDIDDARAVCDRLGIPHYVLDYESLFQESVIDDFADSYLRGETPIPCVRCNQSVKFRDLFKVAKDLEAQALVTGHYVQRIKTNNTVEMHVGADAGKDQSYFLFATTQEQLNFLHFPIGSWSKDETRRQAERFGLVVADKPDSQDICFVPNGDYTSIVSKLRPGAMDSGEIVHIDGTILGTHQGIINYTVGQRRGLGISSPNPLYVVRIDPESKNIIVGPESALYQKIFIVKDVNWLGDCPIPTEGIRACVRTRSAHPGAMATLYPYSHTNSSEHQLKIVLDKEEKAISPGQAGVFYDETRLLGGGWITQEHQQKSLEG